jgi:Xaa-Pro aminopeptidase
MNLINQIRQFLKDNKIDYLLVNSTNEFLVEYSHLKENARYFLTNFSGSTGDALISQNNIFLFVDGRYSEQAIREVDANLVEIVNIKPEKDFLTLFLEKMQPDKTLALVSQKNSQSFYENLKKKLKIKNIKIDLLNYDPVIKFVNEKFIKNCEIERIKTELSGITADEKLNLISKNLKKNEAILLTNLEEISYLCNLRDFATEYSSKIEAKCLIKNNSAILFLNCLIADTGKNFKVINLKDFENYLKTSKDIDTFFADKDAINIYDYKLLGKKVKTLNENPLKIMKSIKTNAELEHYKKCFKNTDKALLATKEFIEKNDNISEYDITQNLRENFIKFEAKSLSFKPIVAKDKNSALAHYSNSSKIEILQEGSLILIDCGAYYEGGYATDCTRVFVKGNPSALKKKIYTIVLKGFLKAFNKEITPITTGFELDNEARKVLNDNKPEGFEFSHSLGHGIGINVHENPPSLSFSQKAKTPLKQNMCFTIEPGLYNKNFFGIRLENSCYLAKENNKLIIKSLSNMPFEKKLINFDSLTQTEQEQLKNFEVK